MKLDKAGSAWAQREQPAISFGAGVGESGEGWTADAVWLGEEGKVARLPGFEEMILQFENRVASLPDLDASQVQLDLEDGMLVLTGWVNGKDARRRVGACAVAVAEDLQVSNRVKITSPDRGDGR